MPGVRLVCKTALHVVAGRVRLATAGPCLGGALVMGDSMGEVQVSDGPFGFINMTVFEPS